MTEIQALELEPGMVIEVEQGRGYVTAVDVHKRDERPILVVTRYISHDITHVVSFVAQEKVRVLA